MRPPSYSTAELFSRLKAAWVEYKEAKDAGNDERAEAIKARIKSLQNELDITTSERDFNQAAF